MKVAYLTTSYGIGGAPIQIHRMCCYMKAHGYDVLLLSMLPAESDEMVNELLDKGIEYRSLNMQRGKAHAGDLFKLVRVINSQKPDVIHSHMVHANFMIRAARPFIKCKTIINTIHGEEEYLGKRRLVYRSTDFLASYTVCVGEVLARQAVQYKIVRPEKLRVIYNGLDILSYSRDDQLGKELRRTYALSPDEFVWVTVGRYERVKNQEYLIKEFGKLVQRFKNAKLFLVGYGEEENNLQQLVADQKLKNQVLVTGKRTDVSAFLSMADAFVLSSLHEGLPLTMQEAGAAELPMVCTDVGGCSEIVSNGENGFLCESNVPGQLYEAMSKIMECSPEERAKMGSISRQKVISKFDINNTMEEWLGLYE